jgi:hypothetical protein
MDLRDRRLFNKVLEEVCNLLAELEDLRGTATERDDAFSTIHRDAMVLMRRTNKVLERAGLTRIEPPIIDFDEASHHEARATLQAFLWRRREELDTLVRKP